MAELTGFRCGGEARMGLQKFEFICPGRFSCKRLLRNEANKCCVFSGWIECGLGNSVVAAA
jgi:hypothetical protein